MSKRSGSSIVNGITTTFGTGERIATYEIADTQMPEGSTLGSPKSVLIIKATGAIEKFYSSDAGKVAIGSVVVHHWDERTGIPLPALPGKFVIHPDHQEHIFELFNGVKVREDIFVLSGKPEGTRVDPPVAYLTLEMTNDTEKEVRVATYVSAQLRGGTGYDVRTSYSEKHRALAVWNDRRRRFRPAFRLLGQAGELRNDDQCGKGERH